MTISESISNFAVKVEQGCKAHLPAPIVSFGGRIYKFLSFRTMQPNENKALYLVRESIATIAKAFFLVSATTFTIIALKASAILLVSTLAFAVVFLAVRSDTLASKITNLFPKKASAQPAAE